jgi:hypothetical protein
MANKRENCMTDEGYFVEPRDDGRFSMKTGGKRASAIADTQKEAIRIARQFDPGKKHHVARVRTTDEGRPGELRKNP